MRGQKLAVEEIVQLGGSLLTCGTMIALIATGARFAAVCSYALFLWTVVAAAMLIWGRRQ